MSVGYADDRLGEIAVTEAHRSEHGAVRCTLKALGDGAATGVVGHGGNVWEGREGREGRKNGKTERREGREGGKRGKTKRRGEGYSTPPPRRFRLSRYVPTATPGVTAASLRSPVRI